MIAKTMIPVIVFGIVMFVITVMWDVNKSNINLCEDYWAEPCEKFGFMDKKCYCASGNRTTTQEMIDVRNQEIADFNKGINDAYFKEKYAGVEDINLERFIVE